MASNIPGECCLKGVVHEGTPKGEIVQFADGLIQVLVYTRLAADMEFLSSGILHHKAR